MHSTYCNTGNYGDILLNVLGFYLDVKVQHRSLYKTTLKVFDPQNNTLVCFLSESEQFDISLMTVLKLYCRQH